MDGVCLRMKIRRMRRMRRMIRRRASVVRETSGRRVSQHDGEKHRGMKTRVEEELVQCSSSPRVYRECELYELAFSYRNVETEVEYILAQYQRWNEVSTSSQDRSDGVPLCILELGAGPAAHAIETARQLEHTASPTTVARLEHGGAIHCLDIEPCMRTLGLRRAAEAGVSLEYHIANMRAFELDDNVQGRVELAFCLLGSLAHLETVNDLLGFFASAHAAMRTGGILVLELEHPSNFLFCDQGDAQHRQSAGESWYIEEEEDDDYDDSVSSRGPSATTSEARKRLGVSWGSAEDEVDPVAGIRRRTVGFTLYGEMRQTRDDEKDAHAKRRGGDRHVIEHWEEVVNARAITVPELELLATKCSGFDIVEMHGEMESSMDVPVDVEDAYRLVVTLRKR